MMIPAEGHPRVTYVEERGLWHIVEHDDVREVVTLCERTVDDARAYPLDVEPKPMCWRCRERLPGP